MATPLKLKRSTTPSAVPSALEAGELAINHADRRMFARGGTGETVEDIRKWFAVRGLGGGVAGKPAANQLVGGGIAPYSFTLSAANSTAIANIAATSSTVFIIKRNGTQIGTITFSASATVGIVSFTQTSVSAGQRVEIYAPASVDGAPEDILFLLRE